MPNKLGGLELVKILLAGLSVLWVLVILIGTQEYTYADQEYTPLTSHALADPRNSGQIFEFSGCVISSFETDQGILILKLHDTDQEMYIEVPVFPSAGRLVEKPREGDSVSVIGSLGEYKGKPQIKPLAVEHIVIAGICGPPTSLENAVSQTGKTMLVGPLDIIDAELFKSASGKQHLRIRVRQSKHYASGIMFDGKWSEADLKMLNSERKIFLYTKIDQYRGQPSLQVIRVISQEI
jgi:hypothetical protein